MVATLPTIGGTDAAVRSALLQSLRCLLTRIRIRIRAQSDTTHVSEHDGNHVRSTIAHQRVTVTFHECVIARKTCCSNGLGSHLNADQREQGNTFLMPVVALCLRHPTQSSSLPHTPCRAIWASTQGTHVSSRLTCHARHVAFTHPHADGVYVPSSFACLSRGAARTRRTIATQLEPARTISQLGAHCIYTTR